MKYLLDTNILTRLVEPGHAMHQSALDAVKTLGRRGDALYIAPQNLYEFWVVCTRPLAVNGLGKTPAEALSELAQLKSLFLRLNDVPAIYDVWEYLVPSVPVVGKPAHDARLVASMSVHGLTHLLTFNVQDFQGFTGITAVSPSSILSP